MVNELHFYDLNCNLIKYAITTEEVVLNNGINKIISCCPSSIQWENVIAVIPYISGGYVDVTRTSIGSYGGDGFAYIYVDSYWNDTVTTTAKIVWLYISIN